VRPEAIQPLSPELRGSEKEVERAIMYGRTDPSPQFFIRNASHLQHSTVSNRSTDRPEILRITRMEQVGTYSLKVTFNDGTTKQGTLRPSSGGKSSSPSEIRIDSARWPSTRQWGPLPGPTGPTSRPRRSTIWRTSRRSRSASNGARLCAPPQSPSPRKTRFVRGGPPRKSAQRPHPNLQRGDPKSRRSGRRP